MTAPHDAAVFGLIVADLIAVPMDLRRPPAPGGLVPLDSLTLTTGGNVCNTGVALAKLGATTAACGRVGNDVLGRAVVESLQAAGLNTTCVQSDNRAQTSATVVAVEPGGERCFFHTPGVTPFLDADAFRACFDLFSRSRFIQIGYFGLLPTLTPRLPALLEEFRKLHPIGPKIALDTVNPPADPSLLWPILPHLDLFCPSRSEAMALTGLSDPKQIARQFRSKMREGAIVGIKLDAEGCLLDDGKQVHVVPSFRIDVVDTTGAGDTWFAGLIAALLRGMPLDRAGRFANRVAADCCTAIGASAGLRSFDDVLARLD